VAGTTVRSGGFANTDLDQQLKTRGIHRLSVNTGEQQFVA